MSSESTAPTTPLLRRMFRLGVLGAVVALGWLIPPIAAADSGHAVVFMYHRFGEDDFPSTNVRLEQFEDQLDHLEENDFHVWSLEDIVTAMQDGESIPDRTVAITVDDAYRSVYEEAYPRMKERGWPMTVFVATDDLDAGREGNMTWDQVREMQESGLVTFANHSASHDYLVRPKDGESEEEWEQRMRDDVNKAQRRLQEELGDEANEDPRLYAYPFGEYNTRLAEIITEKGYIAFGQHSGALGGLDDPRALPRFPVNEQFGYINDFALRARSLPMPVVDVDPWEPLLGENNPPRMVLELDLGQRPVAVNRLACFASGQGEMDVERLDENAANERVRVAVEAENAFGRGRARYNCTAPHRQQSGRFFWFSKQWLNP